MNPGVQHCNSFPLKYVWRQETLCPTRLSIQLGDKRIDIHGNITICKSILIMRTFNGWFLTLKIESWISYLWTLSDHLPWAVPRPKNSSCTTKFSILAPETATAPHSHPYKHEGSRSSTPKPYHCWGQGTSPLSHATQASWRCNLEWFPWWWAHSTTGKLSREEHPLERPVKGTCSMYYWSTRIWVFFCLCRSQVQWRVRDSGVVRCFV
jgi:hypothetical protein